MGNIALQYGPLTIAVQDVNNAGTVFNWSLLGSQSANATSTTGTASTLVAAVNAAQAAAATAVGQFGLPTGLGFNFTNPLSGPNTMFPAADSPGAQVSPIDDDFSGNYLNSKWTLLANGAAATTTQRFGQGSMTLYPTPTVAVNVSSVLTPAPSQTFEVTAKINVNGIGAVGPFGGLIIGDSAAAASVKMGVIGCLTTTNTVQYNTYTTPTGTFANVATGVTYKRPQYFRINYNLAGTGFIYYNWSEDGVSFFNSGELFPSHYAGTLALAALSAFRTTTSAFLLTTPLAGVIGFGGHSGIVANGGFSVSCEWIRQTA